MSGLTCQRVTWPADGSLVMLDAARRVYAGLSRDGAYVHLVHPSPIDLVNADGATVRTEGQLVCTCKGSAFRGTCYQVERAEAIEAGQPKAPAWHDAAPGELTEAFGR